MNTKKIFILCFFINIFLSLNILAEENLTEQINWAHNESLLVLQKNSLSIEVKGLGQQKILMAGSAHFAALWTRDFAFGSLGALSGNMFEPVKGGLESLFMYQRKDGLFPRRVGGSSNVLRGFLSKLGIKQKPTKVLKKAEYKSGLGGVPIDSNPLIAWVMEVYIEKSNDEAFLQKYWDQLNLGFEWMESQEEDGLLLQTPYADWKDVTKRDGKVMYSNVVYYRGLMAMKNLAEQLNQFELAQVYLSKAENLKIKIFENFWNEELGYFKDTLSSQADFYSADGNFLAILFGLTDLNQTEKILNQAQMVLKNESSGLYANVDRAYPNSMVPLSIRLVGIKGYGDNTYIYPWNTALFVLASLKYPSANNKIMAEQALQDLINTIKLYGFQEAYDKNGKPVHRWAHKSEPDFSWFAGLMAYATSESLKHLAP